MQIEQFEQNLIIAAQHAMPYTQGYVIEPLPNQYHFVRIDEEETKRLNKKHPDRPFIRAYQEPITADQVIDLFWRDNKHPERVVLEVVNISGDFCIILVTGEGKWTDDDEHMMRFAKIYKNQHPPFSNSVTLPPFYCKEKFSIHWRENYRVSFWKRMKIKFFLSRLYAHYWMWRYGKRCREFWDREAEAKRKTAEKQ